MDPLSIFALFMLTIIVILIFVFGRILLNIGKLLPEEKGKTPFFTGRYSGQVGWLYYRGPLVRLSVYDNFLVVANSRTYLFRVTDIEKITVGKRLWLNTIDIKHRRSDYPKQIRVTAKMNDALRTWVKDKGLG